MPFARVDSSPDFPAQERAALAFWDARRIFEQRRAKNAGGPRWSFLDGPITANNPMGVHHAWGRTYKDAYQRFFAMCGRDQRYQNGFDCQGLWVEVEVEKELKLGSKRDIEGLVPGDRDASVAQFVQACKDRVDRFARTQTDQSIRLGMWMDWDRTDADWAKPAGERKSYFTMAPQNNYAIWDFLKKCHGNGLIYRGYDAMPWCGRCGVGISEQEIKEGYRLIEHRSAFVKLPLLDRPGEHLLVWTTTPWTLTSNVAAAVNPELTYLRVKLKGEVYYVAKGAFKLNRMAGGDDEDGDAKKGKRAWLDGVPHLKSIEQLFKEKAGKDGFTIDGEVTGQAMLGWRYAGPFDDLPAQQHPGGFPAEVATVALARGWAAAVSGADAHRVISGGKDVTEGEGTGIVHTAPGCGQIDFAWGKENKLPPVAPLDEAGVFAPGFGELSGKNAVDKATADAVFDHLRASDRLFADERYVHRYPHCWRCKTELLYRLVDEWFIGMGDKPERVDGVESWQPGAFRTQINEVVRQVTFLPESLGGQKREEDWLRNMGDWMISKKRYWGLALPIWVDDVTGEFEVIGSFEELKERAVEGWDQFEGQTPHRPFVDKVKLRNPTTGNLMTRVPDVGNPWLDAGIVAVSTLPADWYPADFITESFPGQFRNWFYSLLALSTMVTDGRPPFKTLLGFATVKDQHGHDMHKSAGNSIEFNHAADEFGADVMRWLYCRHSPTSNLNFGPEPAAEVRARFHLKLWNCYSFFCNYAALDGFDPALPAVPVSQRPDIDRWILSDLQLLVTTCRAGFESYDVQSACLAVERFVDDKLSNWYVRRNRRRFWSKSGEDATKPAAYQTLHTVLTTLCRLIAPVVPFLAETMWQNLGTGIESVHLTNYPEADQSLIDPELSTDTERLLELVNLGGSARNQAGVRGRQPLAELRVRAGSPAVQRAADRFADLLRDELNVKAVSTDAATGPALKVGVRMNRKTAAAKLRAAGKAAEEQLAAADPVAVAASLRSGTFTLAGVELAAEDFQVEYAAPDGWAGVADGGTQVLLDTRITPALRAEGLAREVVRLVQDARKAAGLDVADKIALHLVTTGELAEAIAAHRETIAAEVQATAWAADPLSGYAVEAEADGLPLTITLRKEG